MKDTAIKVMQEYGIPVYPKVEPPHGAVEALTQYKHTIFHKDGYGTTSFR